MDKGKRKKIIPQILCILLSLGLWLYISNVENPVRTYELKNIPVELVNLAGLKQSEFAIVNDKQFSVDLKLEGPSNEVLKVKKDDFKVIADMSTYALKEGENSIPVQILGYPENVSIKNNGFIGIKVILEKYITKEFEIKSNVNLSYGELVYEKDKSINPKVVTISGGESKVNEVKSAILVGDEKNIISDMKKTYNINFVDDKGEEVKNIDSNITSAELSVSVSQGKSVSINPQTSGELPEGYILKDIYVNDGKINITGEDSILESIKQIYTQKIDISNFTDDKTINVKLDIPHGIILKGHTDVAEVQIDIEKEEPISKELICNVKYYNLPEEFMAEDTTNSVKVKIHGLKKYIDPVNEENIEVKMDLAEIKNEGSFSYVPEVSVPNPDKITVTDVENVYVKIAKITSNEE